MSASITCFSRVAVLVNAKRLISMIPPSVAKDFVGTDEVGEVRDIGEVHLRLQ
jgi:hypothetical protein